MIRRHKSLALVLIIGLSILVVSCAGSAEPGPVLISDASSVADGAWEGRGYWFPNDVKVSVRVESGKILSVDILKHFNGQGKPAEAIAEKVIAAQSLLVDAVSGATHSSVTIIKAIENALSHGIK